MRLANIYIEHPTLSLDQCFSYRYTQEELQPGMRVWVPFAHQRLVGFVDSLSEISEEEAARLPYQIREVLEVIDHGPLLNEELRALGKWMAQMYVASTISCYQSMLPKVLKPKAGKAHAVMEEVAYFDHVIDGLTPRQREVLSEMEQCGSMPAVQYRRQYKSVARTLIEKGCVRIERREKQATLVKGVAQTASHTLTKEQQAALSALQQGEGHSVVVLHGVTGSGKSEVFLRYADQQVQQGKQVLFLVPEIALTPQMQRAVEARFGDGAAIYHSHLSDQQKYEQYQLVAQGKVQVVVGTRSAIFLPFARLGAIILDEEHDTSYKQENAPRYHCRDIAIWRGRHHGCKVILASATPSLESYARAYKGVYQLIEMKSRIHQDLPTVEIVDMGAALRRGENALLSERLREAIAETLARGEQVMLLLNRRGYTPVLRCIDCGEALMCPHCDVALSYHKEEQRMKCHICGYSRPLPDTCPSCHGTQFRYLGIGTQRLEEYVRTCFPQATIIRMDSDATRRKGAHEQLLRQFSREGDILLGTQMIAKGLDYENVTLVGIINGDASLKSGDYRSSELTFDLLEQACGRSGRGQKEGRVILQAYDCEHYAVRCAAAHDYQRFFAAEMNYRHLAQYPPYTYLSAAFFVHRDARVALEGANHAMVALQKQQICKVLGPIALGRQKDVYRYRVILKGKDRMGQAQLLRQMFEQHRHAKQRARMEIDVDLLLLE